MQENTFATNTVILIDTTQKQCKRSQRQLYCQLTSITLEDNFFSKSDNLYISSIFKWLIKLLGELAIYGKCKNVSHMTMLLLEFSIESTV